MGESNLDQSRHLESLTLGRRSVQDWSAGVMDGNDHGVLRLPSYCLCDKDACQCGGSKNSSSEQIYDTKQSPAISGQALAASVLAWFGKMRGGSAKPPPAPPVWEVSTHRFETQETHEYEER